MLAQLDYASQINEYQTENVWQLSELEIDNVSGGPGPIAIVVVRAVAGAILGAGAAAATGGDAEDIAKGAAIGAVAGATGGFLKIKGF